MRNNEIIEVGIPELLTTAEQVARAMRQSGVVDSSAVELFQTTTRDARTAIKNRRTAIKNRQGKRKKSQKYNLRGITKQTVLKGKKLTEYRKVLRQAIDNYISYLEGKKGGGINVFSVDTSLPKKMLRAPIKEIQIALDQHGGTAIGHILLNDQKEFAKRVLKARLNKVDTKKK